jgi:hypothetical protein
MYLEATEDLELEDVYAGNKAWSDLCPDAGLAVAPAGPHEKSLRRACGRLLHVDDMTRIGEYDSSIDCPAISSHPSRPPSLDRRPGARRARSDGWFAHQLCDGPKPTLRGDALEPPLQCGPGRDVDTRLVREEEMRRT